MALQVREDPDAQWHMSRVARQHHSQQGRGSVNFRFGSPELAELYVRGGWAALPPSNAYLHYNTIPELIDERKEPSLIALCRKYDPKSKFILSVSVIADIEECPETPVGERGDSLLYDSSIGQADQQPQLYHTQSMVTSKPIDWNANVQQQQRRYQRSNYNNVGSAVPDAKTVLKSVLRSMENIAPGEPSVLTPSAASDYRSSSAAHYYAPNYRSLV